MKKPLVGIIMGSSSDSRIMHAAAEILDEFGVPHEDQIISAHRTPTFPFQTVGRVTQSLLLT